MPTLEEEKLEAGHAAEIAFVIKKFKELPPEEQEWVYEALHHPDNPPPQVDVAIKLRSLVGRADDHWTELTQFVNEYFGAPRIFHTYIPSFASAEGSLRLTRYFHKHLKWVENGGFSIEEIERPAA